MSKIKAIVVALFAVFALSAVAASSASADWFINGTKLVGSAELATTAKVDTDFTLVINTATKIKILCTGNTLDALEPLIDSTNGFTARDLTFLGCSTVEPATKCILEGQPTSILTLPIEGFATKGPGNSVRGHFKPTTKNQFATLQFSENNTCALSAEEPVNGSVTGGSENGQSEEVLHGLEALGTTENNSLEIAGVHAYIVGGKALLQLLSGSKWSFR
jgi:hypothetical protein